MLKNNYSDFMMNVYYLTVKINGDPIEPTPPGLPPNRTMVSGTMPYSIDMNSMGQIQFSMPVQPWIFDPSNKTLLWQVFNIYVVDVNQN